MSFDMLVSPGSTTAHYFGSSVRTTLFDDNESDDEESEYDDDACYEIPIITPIHSAATIPAGGNQGGGSTPSVAEGPSNRGKAVMDDVVDTSIRSVGHSQAFTSSTPVSRDLIGDAIDRDFFPFPPDPYYARYPEDSVDVGSYEVSREEWEGPHQPTLSILTKEMFKDPDELGYEGVSSIEAKLTHIFIKIERMEEEVRRTESRGMGTQPLTEPAPQTQTTPSLAFVMENIDMLRTMIKEHDQSRVTGRTLEKLPGLDIGAKVFEAVFIQIFDELPPSMCIPLPWWPSIIPSNMIGLSVKLFWGIVGKLPLSVSSVDNNRWGGGGGKLMIFMAKISFGVLMSGVKLSLLEKEQNSAERICDSKVSLTLQCHNGKNQNEKSWSRGINHSFYDQVPDEPGGCHDGDKSDKELMFPKEGKVEIARGKIKICSKRMDHYVTNGSMLPIGYNQQLLNILRKSMDVFAWVGSEGTTVPRFVMEHQVLASQKGRNVEVYLEEIVGKSKNEQSLIQDVEETLGKLQRVNVKINPDKCSFEMEEGRQELEDDCDEIKLWNEGNGSRFLDA
nr:retrotransposon protein, putative, unclassified [Tanacetum cinerariifolium]